MGILRGFDIYPPLEDKARDNDKWAFFLEAVASHYEEKEDRNMHFDSKGNIVFTVGEHPTLMRRGYYFRRFVSKVSGRCFEAERYIFQVQKMAEEYFGERVVPWYDAADIFGPYDQREVNEAAKPGVSLVSCVVCQYSRLISGSSCPRSRLRRHSHT